MHGLKTKKHAKYSPPKRGLPWFGWLAIGLGIVAIIAFARASPENKPVGSSDTCELKAVIVDQLYSLQPNQGFIQQITQELENYGFEVELYQGDEITVDFYGSLPDKGYKIIIFRAHSGLLSHEEGSHREVTRATCLFTNEPYSKVKHQREQLNGELARARVTEGYPIVFAIGARFINHSAEGEFPNSVIIVMGCSCLCIEDLAQAFIDKGASAYLAWDAVVDLNYVDKATPYLVRQLCVDEATIEEAVANTMDIVGPDPKYKATLRYFPSQSGDRTLRELLD